MNRIANRTKRTSRAFLFALAMILAFCACLPAVRAAAADKPAASPTDADCPHAEGKEKQENYVAPTCVKEGSYDKVTRCKICGEILRTEHVRLKKTDRHIPGPVTVENVKEPTCTENGEYDEITRCQNCGKLLDTNHVIVSCPKQHTPAAPVKENVVAASCRNAGSYDSVVYCEVCGKELSRTHKQMEKIQPVPDYLLKRTVRSDDTGRTVVTFEDPAYLPLIKDAALPSAYEGKTVEAGQFLAGDGSKRTCADGETRCALCGELLEEAIPHNWDREKLAKPDKPNTDGNVIFSCLSCGESFTFFAGIRISGNDIDGDGKLTPADARFVLRYSVGLGKYDKVITFSNYHLADADKNGVIEPADARLILRLAVGLRAE